MDITYTSRSLPWFDAHPRGRLASLILLAALTAGCVTQPARLSDTASGRPEAVIRSTDVDLIKARITREMLTLKASSRYSLETDSPLRLVFSRSLLGTGMEAFAASLMVGNLYSTEYMVVRFTLIPESDTTTVVGETLIRANFTTGGTKEASLDSNASVYNELHLLLQRVKGSIEAEAKTS